MSLFPTHDSFRVAAALLVRAGAGSALTALMLLVLASASSCGLASGSPRTSPAAAVDGAPLDAPSTEERPCYEPHAPHAGRQAPRVFDLTPCRWRNASDRTLPPTRGP